MKLLKAIVISARITLLNIQRCKMERREPEATVSRDATLRESDYQRWADDGGFIPKPEATRSVAALNVIARIPWAAIGVATGIGFALGWLIGCRK